MKTTQGGKRLRRLLTVVLFAFFALFAMLEPVSAQVYSDDDTLIINSVAGFPGDTVTISVDLVNTFAVGGFQVRLTFDEVNLQPLVMRLGARAQQFDLFGSNFADPGVAVFYATSWRPLENAIPPGTGSIAELDFRIDGAAVPGYYFLRFEDTDSLSHQNALSNALGDTLIIPVFVERPIVVLPVESVDEGPAAPTKLQLSQNYPNPFNGATVFAFTLFAPTSVELTIVDILGRTIAVPYSGMTPAGETRVYWNGKTMDGRDVVSGIYFFSLKDIGGNSVTKKMTLLK
jgi:hypothetical protein